MNLATCGLLVGLCALSAAAATTEEDVRGLIEDGRWKRARAVLEPRVKANPTDAEAAAMLSRVRLAYGDLEGAAGLAETAVKLNGQVAENHWLLARAFGEQARKASLMKQFGLAKRFRQEAEAAIALDPKHIQSRLYLISYYAGAPGIAGGDAKRAEQIAAEVAAIDPAWGHMARARLLEETKPATDKQTADELAALYKKALEAAKTPAMRSEALSALIGVSLSPPAQNLDLVEQYGREAVKNDPQRAGSYSALAVAYASRGRWAELDATLAESEKAVPENLAPYYQAGRIILLQGNDYARAERYFRKFLTQEPDAGPVTTAHAYWRLGLTLEKLGRRGDAIAEIEKATRLKRDFDEARKDLRRLRGT
jgi:tetratricopeptide (TPR) repeat protein